MRPVVVLVSSEYPPNICGGLGVHVDRITAVLGGTVECHLMVPRYSQYAATPPGVVLHEIEVPEAASELELWLQFCRAAARYAQNAPFDAQLIHCHDWMTIMAGVWLRQALGLPLVFNVHLPEHIGSRRHLEDIGLVASDLVIVNSMAVAEELTQRGLPVRRMEVVPNGVEPTTFHPGTDWPNDDGYVFFAGRLVAQKGLDVLLRAFAAVSHRWPESRLVVAGEGDLELYFQRMVRYFGLPGRVRFVNWQTGPALVQLYQQAQVVVVPSLYEPFGLVALEAMACGRPVVASRTGGLAEIIEDSVQGYLVPPGDPLQLASRLSNLILQPELRRQMGAAARERALQFTWEHAAARTADLYSGLIGRPVEPSPDTGAFAADLHPLMSPAETDLFEGGAR
jgi:glycosyltransferase involved in cell wall biosynthesis